MNSLLIAAAHKSSGKTTVSVGLCAALTATGKVVQAFKKGPDYIDPMWLAKASARDCFNLDPYLMSDAQIGATFAQHGAGADVCIVEGNKGLYDGLALDGSNSNAALAHQLQLPVVLVIDARGMTRGVAPLILGYQAFDRHLRIVGVILNQLGGVRHESKLRAVIEHYTDVPVLGAIARDASLSVVERHLGLTPSLELDDAAQRIAATGRSIAAQVDIEKLLEITRRSAQPVDMACETSKNRPAYCVNKFVKLDAEPLRIGIARDKAFGFYYPDDLQALESAGVQIVPFDTLHDAKVPCVDGLFIGGGFPEMFMAQLQANSTMRASIRGAVEAGLPVYAECGGLMYLSRNLRWQDKTYEMVGALPADVQMHAQPIGRGYVELQATSDAPWAAGLGASTIRGHEFHYSSLENVARELRFAYKVLRGRGVDGLRDGIVYRNVLASYAHLRSGAGSEWVTGFVTFVRTLKCKNLSASSNDATTSSVCGTSQLVMSTDVEGYLLDLNDWSEDYARARAAAENLVLTEEHWQVIRFLRSHFDHHRVQPQVRTMISHFAAAWGPTTGNNHYLHDLFPMGGPQKQGNRLAGLRKTKGEH